jgi:translation initiation factor IF-3
MPFYLAIIKTGGVFIARGASSKELFINEAIRAKEVRVIGEDGEQLGVLPLDEALAAASAKDLDLVMIAAASKPPVCKIIDYGKYKFEASKKSRENKKNQKVTVTKEIRLSANVGEHDYMVKLNAATKFLKAGDKVKVSIRFRGREITHSELGRKCLERFAEELSELGTADNRPKIEGRQMILMLSPKK